MKKMAYIFVGVLAFNSSAFAVDGVSCTETGVAFDLCASGKITKLTYRKSIDAVLVSGFSAPGCGTGWVLRNPTADEHNKQMYATLMSAYYAGKTVSLTRVGAGTCVSWDGAWKGPITELSLD